MAFRRKRRGIVYDTSANEPVGGALGMKRTAVLVFVFVTVAYPTLAYQHRSHLLHRSHPHAVRNEGQSGFESHSHITCAMVRSYVAQVGLEQAKAMAAAAGMTAADERRARQCLAHRV